MAALLLQLILWLSFSLPIPAPSADVGDLVLTEAYFFASNPGERFLEFQCASEETVTLQGITLQIGTKSILLEDALELRPGDRVVMAPELLDDVENLIILGSLSLSKVKNSVALIAAQGQIITESEIGATLCDPRLADCSARSLVRVSPGSGPLVWTTSEGSPTPGVAGPNEWKARDSRHSESDLRLSEVLYEPHTGRGQLEFIEFVNAGVQPAMLHDLQLIIRSPSRVDTTRIGYAPDVLSPGEAAVSVSPTRKSEAYLLPHDLAAAFPESTADLLPHRVLPLLRSRSLLDSGFHITLVAGSASVDSMFVGPHLHHPALAETRGISIVRRSLETASQVASNWTSTTSRDGATPARYAPLSDTFRARSQGLAIEPRIVSPDAGAAIHVALNTEPSVVSVRVYGLQGRIRRTIAAAELAQGSYTTFWNGTNDSGDRLPPGPYVVLVTVRSAHNKRGFKSVILVNGR